VLFSLCCVSFHTHYTLLVRVHCPRSNWQHQFIFKATTLPQTITPSCMLILWLVSVRVVFEFLTASCIFEHGQSQMILPYTESVSLKAWTICWCSLWWIILQRQVQVSFCLLSLWSIFMWKLDAVRLVANVEDSVHETSCLGFIIAVPFCLETSHWHDDVQLKCFLHNQKFNTVSETRFGKRNSWMV
jgi:hypothetical protein